MAADHAQDHAFQEQAVPLVECVERRRVFALNGCHERNITGGIAVAMLFLRERWGGGWRGRVWGAGFHALSLGKPAAAHNLTTPRSLLRANPDQLTSHAPIAK